jgi:uracil-DNA glycosylase
MSGATRNLSALRKEASACRLCENSLPLGPRPVFQVGTRSRILIAGQAPGSAVHRSGVPFDDPSGDRLRDWMGITREQFYDSQQVAILPMGFCYPGKGKSGDLPPRSECAATWRQSFLAAMPAIRLTVVIGAYARRWHLPDVSGNLTDSVANWRERNDSVLLLPHPSPRNNIWLKKNPWFEIELLPVLKQRVERALAAVDDTSGEAQ